MDTIILHSTLVFFGARWTTKFIEIEERVDAYVNLPTMTEEERADVSGLFSFFAHL